MQHAACFTCETLISIYFHLSNSICAHHFKMLLKKKCKLEHLYNVKITGFFPTSDFFLRET